MSAPDHSIIIIHDRTAGKGAGGAAGKQPNREGAKRAKKDGFLCKKNPWRPWPAPAKSRPGVTKTGVLAVPSFFTAAQRGNCRTAGCRES